MSEPIKPEEGIHCLDEFIMGADVSMGVYGGEQQEDREGEIQLCLVGDSVSANFIEITIRTTDTAAAPKFDEFHAQLDPGTDLDELIQALVRMRQQLSGTPEQ